MKIKNRVERNKNPMHNVPKPTTVQSEMDLVAGEAKEDALINMENAVEQGMVEAEKFDRKADCAFGAEKQEKPEEAEKELKKIELDESLFESQYLDMDGNLHVDDEEDEEGLVPCEWCEELFEPDELSKTDMGWLCDRCISAILSRGEELAVYHGINYCDEHDCDESLEEDYLSVEDYSDLDSQNGNAFWIMGYTANAMKEQGIADEIAEMRERAMSGDYNNLVKVCNEYLTRCNDLYNETDDDYQVEGLEFVTQGLDLSEVLHEEIELPEIGTRLRIITMQGEPNYDGKEGEVIDIDDLGQLHGTWGGLAIVPEVDEFEVI